jgi:ATP-binding cassette subfamily B (MDR/TAP) protein 1
VSRDSCDCALDLIFSCIYVRKQIAVEAIGCIRTVASLHQEKSLVVNYIRALETQFQKSKIRAHLRGITFGIAQSMGNFSYAIALFYGSRLMINDGLAYGDLFKYVREITLLVC